jgi:hypothetical protein
MQEFNQLVLQQAGIIPSPSKRVTVHTPSSDNENRSSDTSSDIDKNTAEKEQCIEPSAINERNNTTTDNTTLPANSGTLLVDATVAEQQIEYPTDLKLLNESREQLERMIKKVCKHGKLRQPRMYKNKARQQYLTVAKKKKKTKKDIRKALRHQLQYVSRDIKYINKLLEQQTTLKAALNKRDWKLLQVIHEVQRQQQEMFTEDKRTIEHRIVSLYQPHVRPIPRGKDRVQTEFGSKQLVMLKDGFTHMQTISWDNFNEGIRLKQCVEAYKDIYGCYPQKVSVDTIFGNKANRQYLKEKAIQFVGKQLGRPPKISSSEKRTLQKEMGRRNEIEGKFGQGKNAYGLQKIKARMKQTSESWIMSIYFIMNLVKLSERAFLCLLKALLQPLMEPLFLTYGSYKTNYNRLLIILFIFII